MLILNIITYFKGYVKIRITGKHAEKFINICAKRNIYVWKIKRINENCLEAFISLEAYKQAEDIAIGSETEIKELKRCGFSVLVNKIMKRSGLIVGFFIALLIFIWMTSRVWYIEIVPSEIPENLIREQMKKAGVEIGVKLSDIDTRKFQASMLNINSDLEWIWAEKSGTKLYIDLRKKVKKPETVDINMPCNLVASHSGKITSCLIKEGRAMVTVGANVSAGQLLSGGILDSTVLGVRKVHSQGSVMADVFIEKSGDYLLTAEKDFETGRKQNSYTVCFGKNQFVLPSKELNFDNVNTYSKTTHFKIGNIYFPFSIIKNTYKETIIKKANLSRDEVIAYAEKCLDELLQKEVGSGTIKERYFFVENVDKNKVRVRLEALCNMEIAKEQPIEED